MSLKLFPGEGESGFVRCSTIAQYLELECWTSKVVGPDALDPRRLGSTQKPPQQKVVAGALRDRTSALSRWYWASLQLIRRAVPFNPLIHLAASCRPPLAQLLHRRLREAQIPSIQSLPPNFNNNHNYSVFQRRPSSVAKMSGLASKQQSLKIFEKLKTKPANKVRAVICNAPWLVPGSFSPSRSIRSSYAVPPHMLTWSTP